MKSIINFGLKAILLLLPLLFIQATCQQSKKCKINATNDGCDEIKDECKQEGCFITSLERVRKKSGDKWGEWKPRKEACDCLSTKILEKCVFVKAKNDGDEKVDKKFKCYGKKCEDDPKKECKVKVTKTALRETAVCKCRNKPA